MATIREVAEIANVAPSTVSRALNGSGYVAESTKKKIQAAVSKLNYVPNQWIRNLYGQKTGIIGVIAPEFIHPYFSSLWNSMQKELHKHGYNMMLCNTTENEKNEREYLDMLERNLFDGIIIGSAVLPDEYYMKIQKPILSLDRIIPGIPLVTSDHCQGGRIAAEKMLECGCKKVLQLSDPKANNVAATRAGITFKQYMQKGGADVVTEQFIWKDVIDYSRSVHRASEILKAYPDLDGMMVNDLCASTFLKIASELGISVPQRLKIIAYDGTYITDFNYRTISAIVQNVSLLAQETVKVLLKLINKQAIMKTEIYVPIQYKEGDTL